MFVFILIAHRVNVIVNDPFVGRAALTDRVKLIEWMFHLVAEVVTEIDLHPPPAAIIKKTAHRRWVIRVVDGFYDGRSGI